MNGRFSQRATTLDFLEKAHGLGLALVHNKHNSHRNGEADQDDTEGAESPAVCRVLVKKLGNLGPAEGRRKTGTHVKTPHDHAVAERCHVRDDDIDNVAETNVSDPVERVAGSIRLDVLTKRLEDHADDDEENHQQKALAATADIDDLSNGQLSYTRDDRAEDGGDSQETMLIE